MTDPAPPVPAAAPVPAPDGADAARRARVRREVRIFVLLGGFGLVVLPFLVYFAGAATLGPYEGGLGTFLGKLYGDFVRLTPAALALLLGPYVLFQGARFLTRPLRHAWKAAKTET